jgi:hypothetical protein
MSRMKILPCVLMSMSLVLQGCTLLALGTGAAAGAGAVAYMKGELRVTYTAPLDRTWEATLGALDDLHYGVMSSQKSESGGEIEAKRVGEDKVSINVSISGPGTTLVAIRVGIFGDEAISRTIQGKITARLEVK